METVMFRVYLAAMLVLVASGGLCVFQARTLAPLAFGLLLLSIGAGGLSAGLFSVAEKSR
jgi:hypothetical protein